MDDDRRRVPGVTVLGMSLAGVVLAAVTLLIALGAGAPGVSFGGAAPASGPIRVEAPVPIIDTLRFERDEPRPRPVGEHPPGLPILVRVVTARGAAVGAVPLRFVTSAGIFSAESDEFGEARAQVALGDFGTASVRVWAPFDPPISSSIHGDITELVLPDRGAFDVTFLEANGQRSQRELIVGISVLPDAGADAVLASAVMRFTALEGTLSLPSVPLGRMFSLTVSGVGLLAVTHRVKGPDHSGTRVSSELTLGAERGVLRGRVIDCDGSPLVRTKILLQSTARDGVSSASARRTAVTQSDGRFVIEEDLPWRSGLVCELRISARDGGRLRERVIPILEPCPSGGLDLGDVGLIAARDVVQGVIFDLEDRPLEDVAVSLHSAGESVDLVTTEADGTFVLTAPPGRDALALTARSPRHRAPASQSVRRGEPLVLHLEPLQRKEVFLNFADGVPSWCVLASLRRPGVSTTAPVEETPVREGRVVLPPAANDGDVSLVLRVLGEPEPFLVQPLSETSNVPLDLTSHLRSVTLRALAPDGTLGRGTLELSTATMLETIVVVGAPLVLATSGQARTCELRLEGSQTVRFEGLHRDETLVTERAVSATLVVAESAWFPAPPGRIEARLHPLSAPPAKGPSWVYRPPSADGAGALRTPRPTPPGTIVCRPTGPGPLEFAPQGAHEFRITVIGYDGDTFWYLPTAPAPLVVTLPAAGPIPEISWGAPPPRRRSSR